MTFEYRDEDGDYLTARPAIGALTPAILLRTGRNPVCVPLDHVEEVVVAGIRDTARTAAARQTGQQPDETAVDQYPRQEGNVTVALAAIRRSIHEALVGLPAPEADRVRDLVASLERAAAGLDASQPATDQAHPAVHRWAAELYDPDADEWVPGTRYSVRDRALNHLAHARKVGPTWKDGTPVERRLVRETTTWTVEEADK